MNLNCSKSSLKFWNHKNKSFSLQSKGPSRVFSSNAVQKHQVFSAQLSFIVQLSHPYVTTGKTIALTRQTFVGKVMSLLFNMLSRLVIAFLPRRKRLLILWLKSPSAVILEPKKIKSLTVSIFSPIYLPWSDGAGSLLFECQVLSQLFQSSLSLSSRNSFVSLHLLL